MADRVIDSAEQLPQFVHNAADWRVVHPVLVAWRLGLGCTAEGEVE